MALHIRNSVECRGYVSFANTDRAHDRLNLSVQGYVDLSQSYHSSGTGVIIAHVDTHKRRRTLVNDAYPLAIEAPVPAIVGAALPLINDMDGYAFDDDDIEANAPTVSCTTEQRSMIKLMKLLDDMEAPDYAVESIIEWAQTALSEGFDFRPKRKSRDGNLKDVYNKVHNSTKLLPSIVPVELLEFSEPVDVITYDFVSQYLSLLHNPKLMTGPKVNFDPANPFARFRSPDNMLGEMHSGSVYNILYDLLITDPTRQLLAPLILYFDKSHVTNGSPRFGLEPGSFTTSLFTEETRRSTEAWRMLGFVHQLLKSSAENAALHTDTNVNNYHRQLNVLLKGIADVQNGLDDRLKNVTITVDDHTFTCEVVCPIICVITDTPAANIACGHYNASAAELARPHRACDSSHNHLADPDRKCVFVNAGHMFELLHNGTKTELKQHSLKAVVNHAFEHLHVGDPERNIWGATVSDIMHSVRQGTLRRANHLMFACLSAKGTKRLDEASRRFHSYHRQSERATFPRSSFVNGISSLAKISAEEQAGVVFTLCCMLQQKHVWDLFDDTLRSQNLNVQDVLQLLECLLCFDAWTRQKTFWARDDVMAARRAEDAISTLLEMIVKRLPRATGHGWKVPTLHSVRHLVREIGTHGAPCNFMAEVPEHNHVRFAKRPGRASQKNNMTFERQAATRISDSMMIARAHELYWPEEVAPDVVDDDDSICDHGGGTKYTIHPPQDGRPPLVEWHTSTSVAYLDLPSGLAAFVMQHYQRTQPMVLQTEYTGTDDVTVRCHPGYRMGEPWYDWVEVCVSPGGTLVRPFKVLAVVPIRDAGSAVIRFELIGFMASERTGLDSVIFTEWDFSLDYRVIKADTIVRRSFVVKVAPKVISVVRPIHEWPNQFAQ